jgi:hypothetical protein
MSFGIYIAGIYHIDVGLAIGALHAARASEAWPLLDRSALC